MSRRIVRPAVLAGLLAAVAAATAAPAVAVEIKHTNRVGGDPDAVPPAANRSAPPSDTAGTHYFDKSHQPGERG